MIFTTNSCGFRTLQDAVSTSTIITYHISSRGRLEIYEDATSKMLVRLAQTPVFPRDLYMYPKQICYMDTLEKKPGPYASIFPFAICTCSPQIGTVRADIPSINRAEGRNKTAMSGGPTRRFSAHTAIDWHRNVCIFQLFWDIVSMSWALIENGRFVAGTVIKVLARTSDVQNVFDWSGRDRSLLLRSYKHSQTLHSKPIFKSQNLFRLHWLVLSAASQ